MNSETFGNGAVRTRSYNNRLQTSQIKLTVGGTVQQQYDYGYGSFNSNTGAVDATQNNGQIGSITSTIAGATQWEQGFSYDSLGRLSSVAEYKQGVLTQQTYQQAYTYDRFGNRFQARNVALGLPAVSSTDIDANTNRFVSTGTTPTIYDNGVAGAGNITQDSKFRMMKFGYDANGRQTTASNLDNSNLETSVYDGLGQRVQTVSSIGTRQVVYDAFGRDIAEYIIGGVQTTSGLTYFMQDEKGSTRVAMSGGNVTARHDFLPFGEEISAGTGLRTTSQGYGGADTNRQKFGGMERDDANGLDHTPWRKYESYGGRWTSPDPYKGSMTIGDPKSFNRYSYVSNDPTNYIDPTGLDMGDYQGISRPSLDVPGGEELFITGLGLGIYFRSLVPSYYLAYQFGLKFLTAGATLSHPEGIDSWKFDFLPQNTASFLDGTTFHTCVDRIYGVDAINIDSSRGGPYSFTGKIKGRLWDRNISLTADTSHTSQYIGVRSHNEGSPSTTLTYIFADPQILLANDEIDNPLNRDVYIQSLFVYEIGNALHNITGKGEQPQNPGRYGPITPNDVGGQLEDCVYGGQVTPKGGLRK